MNLTLAQPFWLLLLPLAILAWRWAMRPSAATDGGPVLLHPDAARMPALASPGRRIPAALLALAVLLLVLALARPQWLGEWIAPPAQGREIVLVVDASPSMLVRDFERDGQMISRMDAMKGALLDFVSQREHDHFSIVMVTDHATTLVPMTSDRDFVRHVIDQLSVGMSGISTALGDGMALALRQIGARTEPRPLLLVFSDGDHNDGVIRPAEALALARNGNMAIYTIDLVGGDEYAIEGEPTMEELAELTGGVAFLARDPDTLAGVAAVIDQRERTVTPPPDSRHRHELFQWPAGGAALALLLVALWRQFNPA